MVTWGGGGLGGWSSGSAERSCEELLIWLLHKIPLVQVRHDSLHRSRCNALQHSSSIVLVESISWCKVEQSDRSILV